MSVILYKDSNDIKVKKTMNKFLVYNPEGQTCGSFFMDLLQKCGAACVDECFNSDFICSGRNYSKVFQSKFSPNSNIETLEEAYDYIGSLECKTNSKWIGQKVCGFQRKKIKDFDGNVSSPDIMKIILRRQSELLIFLTRFFWAKIRRNPDISIEDIHFTNGTHELDLQNVCNVYEVNCEEMFSYETNNIDIVCDKLNIDGTDFKKFAIQSIVAAPVLRLGEVLTDNEIGFLKEKFSYKYYDISPNKILRDCRSIHINIGFI